VGPSLRSEIEGAAALLEELAARWGADADPDCEPKALARLLLGTVPVVYGARATVPAAARWKTQLNENAKLAAFSSELPEASHNEICGWLDGRPGAPLAALFLEDRDQHERVRRRIDAMAREIGEGGAPVARIESRGESRVERLLSLVLLGDLASVYLAVLRGVDPTPVEPIERLKWILGAEHARPD
jgi:glucose/mannose-6-phosphate isomerase